MLTSMNVGDEFYEVEFRPPFEREALKVARALNVSLGGVCKVSVSFVRDPLDNEVLRSKSQARRALDDSSNESQLECLDVDHI